MSTEHPGTESIEDGAKQPPIPAASIDPPIERVRKKRSDAGIPKDGFCVHAAKEHLGVVKTDLLLDRDGLPLVFHSTGELAAWMGANANLGETYQPVVPFGRALALKQAVMVA